MFRPIRYMQENLTYKIQLHMFFVVSAFSATLGRYCCPPPEAGESRVVVQSLRCHSGESEATDEAPSFWGAMASLTDMGS